MAVGDTHQEYSKNSHRWDTSRAVIGGEDVVKGITGEYKPQEFLIEFVPEDKKRYEAYLKRAVFIGYTGWTHSGLLGSVFRKDFTLVVPETIEYIRDNADGQVQGIEQISKQVVSEVLATARCGILSDFPDTSEGSTGEETATLVVYKAEQIYNWRTVVKNNQLILSQVRLKENVEIIEDEFKSKTEEQYRVLALDEDGNYYQEIFNSEQESTGTFYPKNYNGEHLKYIPFVFIGAEDNRPNVDKPPLLDIAFVNLGHYRNSADYEENLHTHGQGTLILGSDMSVEDFLKANPDGIGVGSQKGHFLGSNPYAELLQLNPSQTLLTAMESKVVQMIGIGARFISDGSNDQRVDSVKMNRALKESGLSTLVGNCRDGILTSLYYIMDFMSGESTELEFELNRDFFDNTLSAQEITANVMLVDSGIMAKSDARRLIKKAGILGWQRTDEEIETEIETDI